MTDGQRRSGGIPFYRVGMIVIHHQLCTDLQTTFLCRSPSTGGGEEGPEGVVEVGGSQGRGKCGEAGGGPGSGGKLRGRFSLTNPPFICVSLASLLSWCLG